MAYRRFNKRRMSATKKAYIAGVRAGKRMKYRRKRKW